MRREISDRRDGVAVGHAWARLVLRLTLDPETDTQTAAPRESLKPPLPAVTNEQCPHLRHCHPSPSAPPGGSGCPPRTAELTAVQPKPPAPAKKSPNRPFLLGERSVCTLGMWEPALACPAMYLEGRQIVPLLAGTRSR